MGGEPARKAGSPRWEKRPHPAREPRGAVATSLLSPPGSQRLSCSLSSEGVRSLVRSPTLAARSGSAPSRVNSHGS